MVVKSKKPSRESIKKNPRKLSSKGKFSKASSQSKKDKNKKKCNRWLNKNKQCLIIATAICFAIILIIIIVISVRNSSQKTKVNDKDFRFSQSCVDIHNALRAKHRAPPVSSDSKMVELAATRAAKLVQIDKLVHLPHNRGYGENLYVIWGYLSDCKTVTQSWYNEFKKYKFDFHNPRFSVHTGHATQVIWVASHRIGCAQRHVIHKDSKPKQYTVCLYNPSGNVIGLFKQNVLPSQH